MDEKKILDLLNAKVHQWRKIKTQSVPFRAYVVDACKQNSCGMYGKTWCCPPAVGNMDDLQQKLLKYENALVFTTCKRLSDSFDIEGMNDARVEHEQITDEISALYKKEKALVLSAEGCHICAKCTYPTSPCRFPNKARPSVESYGISVVELASSCGINYSNGQNTVTYFSLIAY